MHTIGGPSSAPIKVPLLIYSRQHEMELDTSAAIAIMSEAKYHELFSKGQLKESSVLLKTYTGERLAVVGDVDVKVQYENQTKDLVLTVVTGNGPSLLRRNWLQHLMLNWQEIRAMRSHAVGSLEYLLDKYHDVFNEELGTIKSFSAKLHVKPDETPKFYKPHSVPYTLRSSIEDEIDRLERQGILEKITHSEWATLIVAVPKPDEKVRLCGDFKVTVNQSLLVDQPR